MKRVVLDDRRCRADRARQVADLLRRQIVGGQFPHGQLPLEAVLAREFGTSRNTVREALDLLREEGLVERCPGVGTTVAAEKYPHGLHRLLGLAETLHEHGEVTNEVRDDGPDRAARPRSASGSGSPAASTVVYIERLRRLNGAAALARPHLPRPRRRRAAVRRRPGEQRHLRADRTDRRAAAGHRPN